MLQKFWSWYERSYATQLRVAAFIFSLQIIHLVWLSWDVVLHRLFETPAILGEISLFQFLLAVVDYLEIPTIVSISLVYINALRKNFRVKELLYLALINSQLLHILWITDEFVIGGGLELSPLLAWTAIAIDYLEIPVIIDTLRRVRSLGLEAFDEKAENEGTLSLNT